MISKNHKCRIARPTDNLNLISEMYIQGLDFKKLGAFLNHNGFDGVIIGHPEHSYHLEFTHHQGSIVGKAPTHDNLLIFYVPNNDEWTQTCEQMMNAGFKLVESFNPYWDEYGKTFEDIDGYRVVLQQKEWLI